MPLIPTSRFWSSRGFAHRRRDKLLGLRAILVEFGLGTFDERLTVRAWPR